MATNAGPRLKPASTASSMNIAVILANQTLADLKNADTNLIPTIRTNTRFRQIFSASDPDDRESLFDPAEDKSFRHPTDFELPDEVANM